MEEFGLVKLFFMLATEDVVDMTLLCRGREDRYPVTGFAPSI